MAESQNSFVRIGLGIVEKKPLSFIGVLCKLLEVATGALQARSSKLFKHVEIHRKNMLWIASSKLLENHQLNKTPIVYH